MIGSRASRHWCTASVVVAATLLVHGTAVGQSRGPVSLIPPPAADRDGPAPPAEPRPDDVTGTLRSIPGTDDSSVRIRGLGAVDADAVGVGNGNSGGLDAEMWRGTSRAAAERLLAAMPERLASDAAYDLARRLLLVAAEPPGAARGSASLVKLRVDKLIALGAAEDAERLLSAVSARTLPDNLVESAIEASLLTGDFDSACRPIETTNRGFVSEFGQKAVIFCQLRNRQFSEAVVGLELLREQNLAQDVIFFELANAIVAGATPTNAQIATPGRASALNLALFRAAAAPVPAWFADADAPSVLKAVVLIGVADREAQLTAARRAAQWGALSPAELADVYDGMGISAEDAAATLLDAGDASPGRRLAVIYLAARGQNLDVARAEVLREMWRLAAEQGDWRLAAQLTAPQLRTITPAPAFSWFAGDAMAASLAAGDVDLALDWYQIAAARGTDEGAAANLTALWPALRMAAGGAPAAPVRGVETRVFDQSGRRTITTIAGAANRAPTRADRIPWDERRLTEWIAQREGEGPQGVATMATVLALLDALGEPVPAAAWSRAEAAEPTSTLLPPLDAWVGLQRAAVDGKVAEAALHALRVVGERDLAELHPAALHSVVSALHRVGLTDAARAFALEVAVSNAP